MSTYNETNRTHSRLDNYFRAQISYIMSSIATDFFKAKAKAKKLWQVKGQAVYVGQHRNPVKEKNNYTAIKELAHATLNVNLTKLIERAPSQTSASTVEK